MDLTVTDLQGRRLSRARSLGRTVLKFVPWELAHGCIWQVSFAASPSSPVYAIVFALVWLAVGANVVSLVVSRRGRRCTTGWPGRWSCAAHRLLT